MDKQTFTELVLESEDTLYRVAWSYLHNDEDARDAVQDAVLLAWEKLAGLRKPEYFRGFVRMCGRVSDLGG